MLFTQWQSVNYITHSAGLLTLHEAVDLADEGPEYVGGCSDVIDQVHPHTAQADENVGDDQVGAVQVDCTSKVPKLEHCQQYGTVAQQGQRQGHQVEHNFAVVYKVQ